MIFKSIFKRKKPKEKSPEYLIPYQCRFPSSLQAIMKQESKLLNATHDEIMSWVLIMWNGKGWFVASKVDHYTISGGSRIFELRLFFKTFESPCAMTVTKLRVLDHNFKSFKVNDEYQYSLIPLDKIDIDIKKELNLI